MEACSNEEGRSVPGTGVEPVFLVSETSVLPARRSRSREAACARRTSPSPRRAMEVVLAQQ